MGRICESQSVADVERRVQDRADVIRESPRGTLGSLHNGPPECRPR